MTRSGKACLILIGMIALAPAWALAQTEEANNVLGQAGPSVLAIISYGADKAEILKGSALALGEDVVVTAYHAVSQAYDVEGRNIKGKKVKIDGLVGVDKERDIALLRPKGKIDALPVGSVESLAEGARIFALGSNESGDVTIVEGTFVKTVDLGPLGNILAVTLAVPEQFRGGPIVDLNGQLVGMLFVGERNLKFGIPIASLVSVTRTGSVMEFKSQTQENYFETVAGNKFAGRAALALDDQLAARTHFERAVKGDPSDLQGHLVLADILSRQRDYSAAAATFRKVTELDTGNAAAYYGLGTILYKQTQYKEAAAALEKAAASGYAGETLYFDLGSAYEAVPDFAKAAEAYEKHIASGPDDAWAAYLRLGICRTGLEQYDQAIAALLEAQQSQPNEVKVRDALAQAYVKAGRLEDAETVYDALAGLNPPEAKNYYRLVYQMYEGAGRFDRAVAPLRKIIELDPNNETNFYYLGMTHFKAEQYDEAVAAFEKSLALKPDFPHAWYQIGSSHFNAKRYRQAAEAYKSYVELAPDDASGWLNIGVSYNQAKNYEAALEPLKKCVELKPEDPVALANLAIVYINLKDNYSAKAIYDKLVTVDPAMAEKLKKYIY